MTKSTRGWFIYLPRSGLKEDSSKPGCYLEEFSQCQNQSFNAPQQPPQPAARWMRPVRCRFKVNYDGAIFQNSAEAGLGVVIRDHTGQAIATLSQKIKYPHSVEATEALTARRAVQFAVDLGLNEAEFEGDSSTIIEALSSGSYNQAVFGSIIEDARSLASRMHCYFFSHVKRSGNVVAHTLARHAQFCSIPAIKRGHVPADLAPLLLQDLSSLI